VRVLLACKIVIRKYTKGVLSERTVKVLPACKVRVVTERTVRKGIRMYSKKVLSECTVQVLSEYTLRE
jgi:hypothetical protein